MASLPPSVILVIVSVVLFCRISTSAQLINSCCIPHPTQDFPVVESVPQLLPAIVYFEFLPAIFQVARTPLEP